MAKLSNREKFFLKKNSSFNGNWKLNKEYLNKIESDYGAHIRKFYEPGVDQYKLTDIITEEEIVNEVARRVAKRIVEAKRAHKKMNEALGRKSVKKNRDAKRRRK